MNRLAAKQPAGARGGNYDDRSKHACMQEESGAKSELKPHEDGVRKTADKAEKST